MKENDTKILQSSDSRLQTILVHVDNESHPSEIHDKIDDLNARHKFDVLLDASGLNNSNIEKISREIQVPVISTRLMIESQDSGEIKSLSSVISFKQSHHLLAEAVRDLINKMNRKNKPVNILYTDEYGEYSIIIG